MRLKLRPQEISVFGPAMECWPQHCGKCAHTVRGMSRAEIGARTTGNRQPRKRRDGFQQCGFTTSVFADEYGYCRVDRQVECLQEREVVRMLVSRRQPFLNHAYAGEIRRAQGHRR